MKRKKCRKCGAMVKPKFEANHKKGHELEKLQAH